MCSIQILWQNVIEIKVCCLLTTVQWKVGQFWHDGWGMSLSTQWLHWAVVTPVLSIIRAEKKGAGTVGDKKKGLEVGSIPLPQMHHLVSWRYQRTGKFSLLLFPEENKMISLCSVSLCKYLHSWQLRDTQIFVDWMHNHEVFSFLTLEFTTETQNLVKGSF